MIFTANQSLVMLVVEDNPADVLFFREAMQASKTLSNLQVVGDGIGALAFLRHLPPFDDVPRPDVIVLDLNLPLKNGHEVMKELSADPELNTIPVAILTTSTSEQCVCDSYPKGRCLYFTKTDDFRQLQDIVREIAAFAQTAQGSA
jgi:two-component system response regulator